MAAALIIYQTKSEVVGSPVQKAEDRDLSIGPAVGYFVANNLAVGLNLGYSSSKSSRNDPNNPSFYEQRGGILQRWTVCEILPNTHRAIWANGNAGYVHSSSYSSNNNGAAEGNGFTSGLTPGLVFFPIPKLGLGISFEELNDHCGVSKSDNVPDKVALSSFCANFSLSQATLSGVYYFGR